MKIAVVSMTYNDGYKIHEWQEHYLAYKDEIEYFVIVDNGSEKEYLDLLKETFPTAVIIERQSNGGCTAAYNDGINYVLKNTDVEAIAIIANDIKLSKNCLKDLYNYLYSDESLGIVSTAVLFKGSTKVDDFGHTIHFLKVTNDDKGKDIKDIKEKSKYTQLVTGGFNMAKREFYEKTGLQDEKLFMYCDELDTSFKAKRAQYKIGVISTSYVWHWHINNPLNEGEVKPFSSYLIARNRVYLGKKYYNPFKSFLTWIYFGIIKPIRFVLVGLIKFKKKYFRVAEYYFVGALNGLKNNMQQNEYSLPGNNK